MSRACTSALQVTLATDSYEVELIEAPAFAMVVSMFVPPRYNGPAKIRLDEITAEPLMSIDGAVTGHENTAVLPMPSLSTLVESARLNVPDTGLIRAHVRVLNVTTDELVSVCCLLASASDRPTTSDMATGPVDACAALSWSNWSNTFMPPTVNWPPMTERFPVTLNPPCIDAPISSDNESTCTVAHRKCML